MIISIQGDPTEVAFIRVFRTALKIEFYALVDDQWVRFFKLTDKRIPTYDQVDWPDPQHMYGWSNPYHLESAKLP